MTCIGTVFFRNDRSLDVMLRKNKTLAYYYLDNHGYTTYYKCFEDFVADYFIENSVQTLKKILKLRKSYKNIMKKCSVMNKYTYIRDNNE